MNITISHNTLPISMGARKQTEQEKINKLLEPLRTDKKATIPPVQLLKGVNLNGNNPFDTFIKIDDATREINFVKSQEAWDDCLLEEFVEFQEARQEYEANNTAQNFNHMQEEMGDIFFTLASISKDSGIDAEEAFKTTLIKNGNRLNLMERMSNKNLSECTDNERRGLWNGAKRKIYDAQSFLYIV